MMMPMMMPMMTPMMMMTMMKKTKSGGSHLNNTTMEKHGNAETTSRRTIPLEDETPATSQPAQHGFYDVPNKVVSPDQCVVAFGTAERQYRVSLNWWESLAIIQVGLV